MGKDDDGGPRAERRKKAFRVYQLRLNIDINVNRRHSDLSNGRRSVPSRIRDSDNLVAPESARTDQCAKSNFERVGSVGDWHARGRAKEISELSCKRGVAGAVEPPTGHHDSNRRGLQLAGILDVYPSRVLKRYYRRCGLWAHRPSMISGSCRRAEKPPRDRASLRALGTHEKCRVN